jgi:hypothetical protein
MGCAQGVLTTAKTIYVDPFANMASPIVEQIGREPCEISGQPTVMLTPERCEQSRQAIASAQRQAQEVAAAAAAQRAQEARNQELDRKRGYERISVQTFALDGKDLAAKAAKVSLAGIYVREGNVDVLYSDSLALYQGRRSGNSIEVTMLTDHAPREFRQRLLTCQSNPGCPQMGCAVTISGQVTTWTLSNAFGATRELPCVAVEDGR